MNEHEDVHRKAMALVALAANFDRKMPEALLELWLELLAPYSADAVRAAVRKVMETYAYKTLPPFAVIKEALDDLAGVSDRSLERQAVAEWGVLLTAIAGHGYCHKPALHPTTEYVVRLLGGWQTVCLWTQSELSFKRRDFVNFWVESHGRVERMEQGAALAAGAVRRALGASRSAPAALAGSVPTSSFSAREAGVRPGGEGSRPGGGIAPGSGVTSASASRSGGRPASLSEAVAAMLSSAGGAPEGL